MFEEGSLALRQHIFNRYRLAFFHSFENNRGIFQDVHRSYNGPAQVRDEVPGALARIVLR